MKTPTCQTLFGIGIGESILIVLGVWRCDQRKLEMTRRNAIRLEEERNGMINILDNELF
jgi:hypothetical protein